MKRILVVILSAVTLSVCNNGPTGADASRYDLVEYFGDRVPVNMTLEMEGAPAPACRDTLLAGYIELASGSSARLLHQHVRNCAGQRTFSDVGRTGTYVMKADTVELTWRLENDPLISRITESAIVVGNQLKIPYRIYTEADPDGTQTAYIIYQRR